MADGATHRVNWLTLGHVGILLTLLGMTAAAVVELASLTYEVGNVRATLEAGIAAEKTLREADKEAVNSKVDNLTKITDQTGRDVRELRSYMMVPGVRRP